MEANDKVFILMVFDRFVKVAVLLDAGFPALRVSLNFVHMKEKSADRSLHRVITV